MIDSIEELIAKDDRTLTLQDMRACSPRHACLPGLRRFTEAKGFDWKTIVKTGFKASELLATDDAMARIILVTFYSRNV